MAIFHADVKVISRSEGRNSVACAAYRSGEKLHDESLHKTFDYSRRESVYANEILAPDNAPEWVYQRAWLWNEVERVENSHNRRNSAQLAREVMVALPTELSHDQKQDLVRSYVRDQFTRHGMVADIGYHDFETQNPHVHILLTMRRVEEKGFGKKEREWNNQDLVGQWRQQWADHANRALEQAGHTARIDHRSHKDRGDDRVPLVHLGASVWGLEKEGLRQGKAAVTDLGKQYQAIEVANDNRQRRQQEIAALEQEATALRAMQRTRKVLQPQPEVSRAIPAITKEVLETKSPPVVSPAPEPSSTVDRAPVPDLSPDAAEKATAAFRNIHQNYSQRTRHHKSPSDIDFAVCKIMAKRGWSDGHIAHGLRHASPDLEQRKPGREWAYTWRTVHNAAKQPDVQAVRDKKRQQEAQTDERQRLSQIEQFKDRERRGAVEQTPRMGVASPLRRREEPPTPALPLPEAQYQARWNAVQASYRKRDSPAYTGNALCEYRKELERQKQLGVHDFDSAVVRQMVDKDITLRLLAAGYSRREVAIALHRGSPEVARQAEQFPYGEWMVIHATETHQARQIVRDYRTWIAEQGHAPPERRLDRLGLATSVDPPEQLAKVPLRQSLPKPERKQTPTPSPAPSTDIQCHPDPVPSFRQKAILDQRLANLHQAITEFTADIEKQEQRRCQADAPQKSRDRDIER